MAKSYTKFYALLRKNPSIDKDEIVLQYTDGRTSHLTAMSDEEFDEMVAALEKATNTPRAALRKARSSALLRLGRLGIDTLDNWDGINAFVSSPKIAGKPFAELSVEELQQLVRKLEMIARAGGLKKLEQEQDPAAPAPFDRPGVVVRVRPTELAS